MAKNTAAEIVDLGFTKEMFGIKSDIEFTPFLDKVLAIQGGLLSGRIGAASYASATSPAQDYVKQAEACVVAAELCRRRILRLATESKTEDGTDAKKLRTTRKEFIEEAEALIVKINAGTATDGSGFASGVSVSSHFAEDA